MGIQLKKGSLVKKKGNPNQKGNLVFKKSSLDPTTKKKTSTTKSFHVLLIPPSLPHSFANTHL
jgi:hypothetical protein